jgi:pilus assembly protein CpaC
MKPSKQSLTRLIGCLLAAGPVLAAAGTVADKVASAPEKPASAAGKAAPAADKPAAVTRSRAASTAPAARGDNDAGRVALAPAMQLSEGKSTLMRLPFPASRVSVGDPKVADVILIKPTELYMLGKNVGTTNLIVWNRENDATIIDLSVSMNVAPLQAQLKQLMPDEKEVQVSSAADSLIVSGMVADTVKAERVLALANAFVQRNSKDPAGAVAPAGKDGALSPRIVNLLSIAAPQQVMLEVKVAEVSKTLVDQLGASLGANHTNGSWTYSILSNLLTGSPSAIGGFNNRNGNFINFDAQKRDGLLKVLAEPTIMAISGQEASFLAGGKIFIPVAQNNNAGLATITLEEKEFGVAVKFTPTVLEGGRINLRVAPEVSELNKDGIGISATGVSTTALLPAFTTRRANTVVQLFDGQSFAIGGLIKNNVTSNIKAMPFLGDVPVLGALFRSSDFQTDRSELVFIVTPRLVKPLPPDYRLPTDGYIEPTRSEYLLQGKLEGKTADAAQPANKTAGGFDLK